MPYWLHDREMQPQSGEPFETAAHAKQEMTDPARQKITFCATEQERSIWQYREQARFSSGEYLQVPWIVDGYYTTETNAHYAHLSLKTPGLIAYTKTEEHALQDRQTAVRPGRYLEQYYKGRFSPDQTARYIGLCSASTMKLHITQDADTIERVYVNGPRSCMGGNEHRRDNWIHGIHPVRVYSAGDLALAYCGSDDQPSARAIVWPEKKRYSRIYGADSILRALLEQTGFKSGSMCGAKVKAITCDEGYVMPYIDGIDTADLHGKYFVLGSGSFSACETQGYTADRELETCSHCGETYDPDDDNAGDGYCGSCNEERSCCADCNEYEFDAHSLQNGDVLCDRCYDNALQTCDIDGCDRAWIERDLPSRTRRDRHNDGTTAICTQCAQNGYHYCSDCAVYTSPDDPCDCNREETDTTEETAPVPEPIGTRADRVNASHYALSAAVNNGRWERVTVAQTCRIADCHAHITIGEIALHASMLAGLEDYYYCATCATTDPRFIDHDDVHVPPMPIARVTEPCERLTCSLCYDNPIPIDPVNVSSETEAVR